MDKIIIPTTNFNKRESVVGIKIEDRMRKILMLFLGLTLVNSMFSQNLPNDCVNAITVCGNGSFSSNASGFGAKQEINACGGLEHNSLWIKIYIVKSGTLGFDLIPDDISINVDYDFWVFGPNKDCNSLGSPIRCATANPLLTGASNNHTGMNLSTAITQVGPGGTNPGNKDCYVRSLNVTAGQFYYIAIDRPVGSGGFTINWTGSATSGAGAFPSPPTANKIADYSKCSGSSNQAIFDLNTRRSLINSDFGNNDIFFYASYSNAIDGVNPLPNVYVNYLTPQTIYAKVVNKTSGCYSIVDFKLRAVQTPTVSFSVSNNQVCSGQPVTLMFNGTPNATVEYEANGVIQTILLNASGFAQKTDVLTVDTTYDLVSAKVLDSNDQSVCPSQPLNGSASVSVNALNLPTFSINSPVCEGSDLVLKFSGLANSVITYNVNNSAPQNVALDGTGNKQVVLTNQPSGTYQITLTKITDSNFPNCSLDLNISETAQIKQNISPVFNQVAPICSGTNMPPLPTISKDGIIGNWSPALDNTTTTTYTFTPDAGQCGATAQMTITVIASPNVNILNNTPSICSGTAVNVDLSTDVSGATIYWGILTTGVTGGTSGSTVGTHAIQDVLTLDNNLMTPHLIKYEVYSDINGCAGSKTQFSVILNPIPHPELKGGLICVNNEGVLISPYVLDSGINDTNHTFAWYHNNAIVSGAKASTYTVDQLSEAGVYSVTATNTDTNCTSSPSNKVEVKASSGAKSGSIKVGEPFSNNPTITVIIDETTSLLLYQLDGGSYQNSNVFYNVKPGPHVIRVIDEQGCTDITLNTSIVGYPNFFTPNGDGQNDTWKIEDIVGEFAVQELLIFDRFGKLVKQLFSGDEGWDGTYNGEKLPSTDYWFVLNYRLGIDQNISTFKSHFALKR